MNCIMCCYMQSNLRKNNDNNNNNNNLAIEVKTSFVRVLRYQFCDRKINFRIKNREF